MNIYVVIDSTKDRNYSDFVKVMYQYYLALLTSDSLFNIAPSNYIQNELGLFWKKTLKVYTIC
jgi:hypothetical protein